MRRSVIACAIVLLLTGCAGDFGAPGPVQGVFSQTLATRYDGLAAACPTGGFSVKAVQAGAGDMPPLTVPEAKMPDAQAGLVAAHDRLLQALRNGAWIDSPADAADAQAAYDCRAASLAGTCAPEPVFPIDPPSALPVTCQERLSSALAALQPPPPQAAVYSIDFASHGIGITPAGMDRIAAIARPVRGRPGWTIVLSGYAAADEILPDDRNIGLRRALSVRNALQQDGIERAAILTAGGDPGAYGNRPRVEARIMTAPDAQALQLAVPALRENFGGVAPVF